MDLSFNIITLIDILALIQGVILGSILIASHRTKRPSLFLGLFLLSYSLELANAVLIKMNVFSHAINIHFLPFSFYFFSVPMFYLYAKRLIAGGWNKKWIWYFVPGVIEFLVLTAIFLLPSKTLLALMMNERTEFIYEAYIISGLLFSIVFAIMTNRLVGNYQNIILNYYSDLGRKQLDWIRVFGRVIIVFYSLWIINIFISESFSSNYLYPVLSVANFVFIYWLGISGVLQPRIEMVVSEDEFAAKEEGKIVLLADDLARKKCFEELCQKVEQQQLFKDSKLTLPKLATRMRVSRRDLSQMINQYTGNNFSTFINQYRVDEAKKMLTNMDFQHLNMVGIAYEVGFSSKATFFAVFKKFTGNSPGHYKRQVKENRKR